MHVNIYTIQMQMNNDDYEPIIGLDVAVANGGSVDSGKSTTVGVLVYGDLDDGNGSARTKVAKHPHELETNRTSDISTRSIRVLDSDELNENKKGHILTMIDLCGHKKYYGTTARGMGQFPDYGMITIAANKGVLPMTKQHMTLMALKKIPFFIIMTKIDIAPKKILELTKKSIDKFIKKIGRYTTHYINKDFYTELESGKLQIISKEQSDAQMKLDIQKMPDLIETLKTKNRIVPVIAISNKTGHYTEYVKTFVSNLKTRAKDIKDMNNGVFIIDACFKPPGQGLVLSGIMKNGTISVGNKIYIGPRGKDFIEASVRSIHYDEDCDRKDMDKKRRNILPKNGRGTIAVSINKKYEFDRNNIKSGMVALTDKEDCDNICYEFIAEIKVIYHKTKITQESYAPFLHINTVAQAAKLMKIHSVLNNNKLLKEEELISRGLQQGDVATVTFRFTQRPEFIYQTNFMFREGETVGSGKVLSITQLKDDENQFPSIVKRPKHKSHKNVAVKRNKI